MSSCDLPFYPGIIIQVFTLSGTVWYSLPSMFLVCAEVLLPALLDSNDCHDGCSLPLLKQGSSTATCPLESVVAEFLDHSLLPVL